MKHGQSALLAFGLILGAPVASRADDAADAKAALVEKAIKAHGGDKLTKLPATTLKMKGAIHTMGVDLTFTAEVVSNGPERQKIDIEAEAGGQKIHIVNVLNGNKGWSSIGGQTTELDKDKLAEAKEEAYAGWVATLAPLKDKAFTLATIGEVEIEKKKALGVKVSRKGHRDVDLYFDKETGLLIKTESRVKDDTSGQEVTEESFPSEFKDVQGTKQAMKFTIKRDGKPFLEGEATECELAEKLDDSVFAKP